MMKQVVKDMNNIIKQAEQTNKLLDIQNNFDVSFVSSSSSSSSSVQF